MKRTRKIITLEVETDAPVSVLRSTINWGADIVIQDVRTGREYALSLIQAQADAVKPKAKKS